jgi:A/G-specific adenine glycosylase
MMDLGATICTPRSPACSQCPLRSHCRAHAEGLAAHLPARAPKPERPQRWGAAFVALRADGHVLLRRRPENGLLGGMMEPPGSAWQAQALTREQALRCAPVAARWRRMPAPVTHTFTHFHLRLDVFAGKVGTDVPAPAPCRWVATDALGQAALPSVMRKVLAAALD